MTITRRDLLAGSGAGLALAALPAGAQRRSAEARAQALIDAIAEERLAAIPERASELGVDTGRRAVLRSRLEDRSPAARPRTVAQLRARVAQVDALDGASLSPAMRTHLDVVRDAYRSALDGLALPYGDVAIGSWRNAPYVVIQNVGAYLDTPRMLDSTMKVETRADADAYLARLDAYAGQLDGETARVRAASARGVVPPDFLLDKALTQLRLSRKGDPASWDVVSSLARRAATFGGDHGARAARIAAQRIGPALDRQIAALEADRSRARSDAGMWAQPDGDRWYAWALSASTTTRMTPDEVHRMGVDQVRELQARMDPLLRAEGFTSGTVGERMIALGKDARYAFPAGDPGRAEIMAFLDRRIDYIRAQMPRAFRTLVRGNVEVKRLPPAEEPGAPGAYGGPGSIDGSIPGRFWINLRDTALHSRYSLPTLAHHEAIPGHVWEGEYSFKMPLIRSILGFNAFSEGWALYAEQLGDELGAYEGDRVGQLGYLQSIAFRACRLVVDTGLHAKRWTRAQAIDWFVSTNGSGRDEVTGEVDRYCSWPGQACGYKVGHSEINRLRDRARAALGPRYDLRDFDDAVVKGGNVPMTVLARTVDRYIAGARA